MLLVVRNLAFLSLLLLAAFVAPAIAAEAYPTRPVKIIVPFPPGGSTDIAARLVAQNLSEKYGQQFVVENRPGANGSIGSAAVAQSKPDGYTLLFGTTSTLAVNPHLYKTSGYEPLRDFAPVIQLVTFTNVLVVHPSVEAKSVKELIALAKAKPGVLNFGSAGTGNTTHLAGELFKKMAGVDIVHVPFKGAAPAVTALLANEIQILFNNTPETLPHIRSGALRALAVTPTERLAVLPDMPTISESGLPGYEVTGWGALVAPAGTPSEVVRQLNAATNEILTKPEVREKFASIDLLLAGGPPEKLGAFMEAEHRKYGDLIREAGIKVE